MTKSNLFASSLVASIPGSILAYFCVMAFLNYGGGSTILLKVTTGLMLVVGLSLPVMSVAILLSGRGGAPSAKKEKPAKEDKKSKAKGKKAEDEEVAVDAEADDAEVATGDLVIEDDIGDDVFDDAAPAKKKK